jgi:hypothetical protein
MVRVLNNKVYVETETKSRRVKWKWAPNLLTKWPLFRIGRSRSLSHSLYTSRHEIRVPPRLSCTCPHPLIWKNLFGRRESSRIYPFRPATHLCPLAVASPSLGSCISFASAAFRSLHRVAFPGGLSSSAFESWVSLPTRWPSHSFEAVARSARPFLLFSFAVRPFLSVLDITVLAGS